MELTISNEVKAYFERQNFNLNDLKKSNFNYKEIVNLLNSYNAFETLENIYDEPGQPDFCVWQDVDYVGNWSSNQEELNEQFIGYIKSIGKIIKKNKVDEACLYIYKNDDMIFLYFPFRRIDFLRDFIFTLKPKID